MRECVTLKFVLQAGSWRQAKISIAVVIIGIYSNEKYLTEKENDSLRWFTSRVCSQRFHCFLIFSLRHQLGVSVSTETYVRGLSRTRQFSSVPTFWLLDCRINRCVERMDTCGEHTYFNVPLSFSFIYNAVSFVVSRMFPSPPFPRPWSFLSKKPEGRSRGMTEVARLRDTKNRRTTSPSSSLSSF